MRNSMVHLALALVVMVSAASASAAAPSAKTPAATNAAHRTLPADSVHSDDSIYLLGGAFTDHDGNEVGLDLFSGHPVLISMFYATCPHACPMLISDMKRVEKALTPGQQKDLRVILVTFDPDRDSEANLKALAEAHQVDTSRWKMLRTDPSKVLEVAAVLGIKYRFAPDGNINHSSVISLLDRKGVVVERLDGLRQPEAPVVKRIQDMKKN